MFYQLDNAGNFEGRNAYDIRTSKGAYAGMIIEKPGWVKLAFDSDASRYSKRRFASIDEALEFMHARRERRGMNGAAR